MMNKKPDCCPNCEGKCKPKKSGHSGGFLTGALLGAAAVFFFGTKKGKKMAKTMHKQGTKSFKELEGLLAEIETKGQEFAKQAKVTTKSLEKKAKSTKKVVNKEAKKKLTHIKKLQQKGRSAAARYFKN